MNLRKDHCRDLPSSTTSERVPQHLARARGGGSGRERPRPKGPGRARALPAPERAHGGRAGLAPLRSRAAPERNHGAVRAKENLKTTPARGRERSRSSPDGQSLYELFKTTLGNGYLGSRIDEERSEMRYLV